MKNNTIALITIAALAVSSFVCADVNTPPAPPDVPEAPAMPRKAFLGVVTDKVSSSTSAQLGLPPGIGLSVKSVVKDSSAEQYGIEKYDILLEMNGQILTSVSHFTTLLSMKAPGDVSTFKLLRKGSEMMVDVTLGGKEIKTSGKWEWEFERKMEEFGRKMEDFAENEDIMRHIHENIDAEEIEANVRSALEKAQYHINQWVSEDGGEHTSIVGSGNARSIITVDEGTLIIEGKTDGKTKVIALGEDDSILYNGTVSEDGSELDSIAPWVKKQYEKFSNKRVKVIVSTDVEIDSETPDLSSDEAG